MTPTELLSASILLTSAPVVSHSINRLERAGFVVRRPHESDGRKTLIEATDEGRKVFFDLYREIQEIQEGFFAPLDEDEIRQVRDLLLRCLSERMS